MMMDGQEITVKNPEHVVEMRLQRQSAEDELIIDEPWLKTFGWVAIGNIWYPPESSTPRQYTSPLLLWCRVDGTIRLGGGNEWCSENDAKRGQLRVLCGVLGVKLIGR